MTPGIIFDLDDTLYAERQFIRSGFRAVAAEVARRFGVAPAQSLRALFGALRTNQRSRALQALCAACDLPPDCVPDLVDTIRAHRPALRLPAASRLTLERMRTSGWRTAVLTNGLPEVQARKVAALGLAPFVDVVVYAQEWGSGKGKPEREPFEVALCRLGTRAERTVVVGNDPWCDIVGGRGVGLRTILIRRCQLPGHVAGADHVTTSVESVPELAVSLVCGGVADAA